jgi:hypothetical protein
MSVNLDNLLPILIPVLMILLFIGSIAFTFVYAKRRRDRAIQRSRDTAAACGLEFREPFTDPASSEALGRSLLSCAPSSRAGPYWSIEGQRDGQDIRVYPETAVRASPPPPTASSASPTASPELRGPHRQGGHLLQTGQGCLSLQDIETGDREFDPLIRVKTKDESSAANPPGDSSVRAPSYRSSAALPDAWADKDHVHWERVADSLTAEELDRVLTAMVPAARALSNRIRRRSLREGKASFPSRHPTLSPRIGIPGLSPLRTH